MAEMAKHMKREGQSVHVQRRFVRARKIGREGRRKEDRERGEGKRVRGML